MDLTRAVAAEALAGVLAEPARLRVLAAVALGATTDAAVVELSGVSARDAAKASRRLVDAGLLENGPDGWAVAYDGLRAAARRGAQAVEPDEDGLGAFLSGGRLRSLPAQWSRRTAVLARICADSFSPDERYDEAAVNARLAPWCEGGEVDHVALRRYLVETGLLVRGGGVYTTATAAEPPRPSAGEALLAGTGLT